MGLAGKALSEVGLATADIANPARVAVHADDINESFFPAIIQEFGGKSAQSVYTSSGGCDDPGGQRVRNNQNVAVSTHQTTCTIIYRCHWAVEVASCCAHTVLAHIKFTNGFPGNTINVYGGSSQPSSCLNLPVYPTASGCERLVFRVCVGIMETRTNGPLQYPASGASIVEPLLTSSVDLIHPIRQECTDDAAYAEVDTAMRKAVATFRIHLSGKYPNGRTRPGPVPVPSGMCTWDD
jgi:hypothetical protein